MRAKPYATEVNVMDAGRKIEDMRHWCRQHDLMQNRVSVMNQMHNCRYARNCANPCQLRHRGGTYDVEVYGEVVTTYGLYDVDGTAAALATMDMLTRLLWNGTAGGWLVARPEGNECWKRLMTA